ncbi:MAG: tetratricopeptide repeat protein [Bacteroidetes bacterium]|nr:tetratricopeptide repeat protein [Bacteroidota bacterium]
MKNRGFFIFLFLISTGWLCASPKETDSTAIMKRLVATNIPADTKLRFLSKLCANYWTIDADSALIYGWQGLPLVKHNVQPKNAGYIHFVLGMAWENKGNSDSALWYLNRAKDILQTCQDKRHYFRVIEQIGSLYRINGKYDTAVVLMSRALDYFKSSGNNYQVMSTLFNIGSAYLEQNRYNKALEYYLASAEYDSMLNDTMAIATHWLGIGNVYSSLGSLFKPYNAEKSKRYLATSRQYYRDCARYFILADHKTGLCFASMNMLASFIDAEMLAQADSMLHSDTACFSFPDTRVTASFRISEAQLFFKQGRKTQAFESLQKVAGTKGEIIVLPEFHDAMLMLAGLMWEQGNHDSARAIAGRSLKWAKENSGWLIAHRALGMMAGWYETDGKAEKALALTREAAIFKDSLFAEIGLEIFDETEMKFKNQLLQAKVVSLENDRKLQKFRTLTISLSGTIFLLILVTIILWLLARHKNVKRKRHEDGQQLSLYAREKELNETVMESLNIAMRLKEQELVYQTLKSADLSQTNLSIREKLEEFQHRFQKKKDQNDFSRMILEIHQNAKQSPLGDFELLFSQMHSGFFEKLLDACPQLSKTELHICALLRLNLSSKDIARVVNLTAASVDVTRSHIRKKLGLDQNQNLSGYLLEID